MTSAHLDRLYLDDDGNPRFARSALLFVDLLGVRELATTPTAGVDLVELDRVIRVPYGDFLEDDSPWPAAFFSDTLVVASPASRIDDPDYEDDQVVGELVFQASWIQAQLAVAGFFCRGAITIGDVHMRERLHFGPALVEAYDLEQREASVPRIVLSANAEAVFRNGTRYYRDPAESLANTLSLVDQDGVVFVDYLGIILDDPDPPEPFLERHRDRIRERLELHGEDPRKWDKYRWVAEYHDAFCSRWLPNERDLLVPAPSRRAFTTLADGTVL